MKKIIFRKKDMQIETGTENEVLRNKSELIKSHEIQKYAKIGREMIAYIKNPENGGVGLAAPQIGIGKRLIVVSLLKSREDENYKTIMMMNPKITYFSKETKTETEGCLSVPGEKVDVTRSQTIKVEFLDEKWQKKVLTLNGVSATIVQHEYDHLEGVLLVDYNA